MADRSKYAALALVVLAGVIFLLLGQLHAAWYVASAFCGLIAATGCFALWENYRNQYIPHTRDFRHKENA